MRNASTVDRRAFRRDQIGTEGGRSVAPPVDADLPWSSAGPVLWTETTLLNSNRRLARLRGSAAGAPVAWITSRSGSDAESEPDQNTQPNARAGKTNQIVARVNSGVFSLRLY